jgi:uncharacterized protein
MATLLVTLAVMLFVAFALGKALGEPDYVCQLCGGDEAKCAELKENSSAEKVADDLSYDASKKDQV